MQNPNEAEVTEDKNKTEEPKQTKINDFDKNIMKFKERKNVKVKVEPLATATEDLSLSENTILISNFNKTGKSILLTSNLRWIELYELVLNCTVFKMNCLFPLTAVSILERLT